MRRSDDDLRDIIRRHQEVRRPVTVVRSALRSALWGKDDPYAGVQLEPPMVVRGPDQQCPILAQLIAELRPARILEVGTYYGGSAIWMAECARRANPEAEVLTIDPWRASALAWGNGRYGRQIRESEGYFKRCVVSYGMEDVITYLPMPSREAFRVVCSRGLTFGFAYIDGGHGYQDVRDDLAMWSQRLGTGSAIVVDDYEPVRFEGVIQAVKEFCAQTEWRCEIVKRKAVLRA